MPDGAGTLQYEFEARPETGEALDIAPGLTGLLLQLQQCRELLHVGHSAVCWRCLAGHNHLGAGGLKGFDNSWQAGIIPGIVLARTCSGIDNQQPITGGGRRLLLEKVVNGEFHPQHAVPGGPDKCHHKQQ